jgi:hypothetical protein
VETPPEEPSSCIARAGQRFKSGMRLTLESGVLTISR